MREAGPAPIFVRLCAAAVGGALGARLDSRGCAFVLIFHTKTGISGAAVIAVEFGHRFYNSDDGRWLNRDPIGEGGFEIARMKALKLLGDGPNYYHFVLNDPIRLIDVNGLGHGNPVCGLGKCYSNQPWNLRSRSSLTTYECIKKIAKKYRRYRSLPGDRHNRVQHCLVSCEAARQCNLFASCVAGWIKELFMQNGGAYIGELTGGRGPAPDTPGDVWANKVGLAIAGTTKDDCERSCRDAFLTGVIK